MIDKTKFYINGAWINPSKDNKFEVINPSNEIPYAIISLGCKTDVDKAVIAARLAQLEIGQIIEGKVLAIKPYGFFIDLGGISGLLHHAMVTNGSIRSLREVFEQAESIKALITELDAKRGRIGLNTALLEGLPGEILVEKEKVLSEAEERAKKVQSLFKKNQEESVEND